MRPRSSAVSASARDEVKQCSRRLESAPPHLLVQDRGGVVVGLAGMDDERQLQLARERDLAAEHPLGDLGRRVIVVVVEPGLADADAFGMRRERSHGVAKSLAASVAASCGCVPTVK